MMRKVLVGMLLPVATAVLLGMGLASDAKVDPKLPSYERVRGVSGSVKSIGSDTLNNVMAQWASLFQKWYPNVKVEIEGKGSKTAPPALIQGQAQFGPMSRPMKPDEIELFKKAFGYEPTQLRAGIDCVAVYVHKDAPVESLTLDQLRMIFSIDGAELRWGDVGVDHPDWRDNLISVYGRNSASGTYDFFKQYALAGADFKPTVKEQPGSSAVVQAIAKDRFGIGYSGVGYRTADVKFVAVGRSEGEAFLPTYEHAVSGEFPLARFLYVYINHDARRPLDRLRGEFIRMMFSREGQEAVMKEGYYPVPATIARDELKRLGLNPTF